MALFAFWRDADVADPAIAPARVTGALHLPAGGAVAHRCGDWHLTVLPAATAFLPADRQLWVEATETCVIHGLPWRMVDGVAVVVDAASMAALIGRPDALPPPDLAGEYAVVRLFRDGTLLAFGDHAALHQIFRHRRRAGIVASRAAIVAALADEVPIADPAIPAIGYRVGTASGWRDVEQLAQARMLVVPPSGGAALRLRPPPIAAGPRGLSRPLLDAGIAQAKAAIRLAVDTADGPLPLGITGGKDSRAVLALALAAGVGDRLDLFTRGPEGHPDVAAGRLLAEAAGLPHRREPPLGDGDTDCTVARFATEMAALAFQTDGNMGGWDRRPCRSRHPAVRPSGRGTESLCQAPARRPVRPGGDGAGTGPVRSDGPAAPRCASEADRGDRRTDGGRQGCRRAGGRSGRPVLPSQPRAELAGRPTRDERA
jgi:hypothetical protein